MISGGCLAIAASSLLASLTNLIKFSCTLHTTQHQFGTNLCQKIKNKEQSINTYQGVRTVGGPLKHCEPCPRSRRAVAAAQWRRHWCFDSTGCNFVYFGLPWTIVLLEGSPETHRVQYWLEDRFCFVFRSWPVLQGQECVPCTSVPWSWDCAQAVSDWLRVCYAPSPSLPSARWKFFWELVFWSVQRHTRLCLSSCFLCCMNPCTV